MKSCIQQCCIWPRQADSWLLKYSKIMTKADRRTYTSLAVHEDQNRRAELSSQSSKPFHLEQKRGNKDTEEYQIRTRSQALQGWGLLHSLQNRRIKSMQTITSHPRNLSSQTQKSKSRSNSPNLPQKRKAGDLPNYGKQKRSSRARQVDNGPCIDEGYIHTMFSIPTPEDYPTAPATLFGPQVETALLELTENALRLDKVFSPTRHGFRCTIRGKLPNDQGISALGDGRSKQTAVQTARLHLLSQLHESGVLKEICKPGNTLLNPKELEEERNAKLDVYNYCARFLLIPEFSYQTTASRINGRAPSRASRGIEVTVELKEHGLRATASARDYNIAETNACFRLKQEIEKYHAEHGEESITINDSETLNSGNAKEFIEFCKLKYRGLLFERRSIPYIIPNTKISLNTVQMILNGVPLGPVVRMHTKKAAEDLSNLIAAVALSQRSPNLQKEFRSALSASGEILSPLRPLDLEMDTNCLAIMKNTLQEVDQAGLPSELNNLESEQTDESTVRVRVRKRLSASQSAYRSEQLLSRLKDFQTNPIVEELRETKAKLPMNQNRTEVLKHIEDHAYSVVVGTTGSGKTTQVPQILLEDAILSNKGAQCDIICTQPRRIAAMSVARRVASERNEDLQDTVGHHVRFDAKLPRPGGSITYCTTGILLQQLQRAPDQILDSISHIIIDEVHERDILIDFLLAIIKKTVQRRRAEGKPTPKIVLMSATIDSELFSKYFEEYLPDGEVLECPAITVPGRTFPVVEKHLEKILGEIEDSHGLHVIRQVEQDEKTRDFLLAEKALKIPTGDAEVSKEENEEATIDWKRKRVVNADGLITDDYEDALVPIPLIATTIAHIAKTTDSGAILVFNPGYEEIKSVLEMLENESPLGINFKDEAKFKIHILHSTIPAAKQQEVFTAVPKGCRKIILSTNIAETSVTIPDVQYVVDSGKVRQKRYDQTRRITKLQCTWISKSNARQRAGRAGRVQDGNYYALYSANRARALNAIGLPEMLRSDLQEVCLDIKAQALKAPIREFLSEVIEPPSASAVETSVASLKALQALTNDEMLTPLGRLLATLPVHPALGKMIVLGVIFRCLDPMIILGACFNERSLFVAPPEQRREAQAKNALFLDGSKSDHIAALNAFRELRRIRDRDGLQRMTRFGFEHFIHNGAFNSIYRAGQQIEDALTDAGLIPRTRPSERNESQFGHPSLNENSSNTSLIKALLLAGYYPNLAVCKGSTFRTADEDKAMMHPSSLNSSTKRTLRERVDSEIPAFGSIYSYSELSRTQDGRSLMKETTLSTPLMAFLFGKKPIVRGNFLEMDNWLPFYFKEASHANSDFRSSRTSRGQTTAIKTFLRFREALDRVLVDAFQELGHLSRAATRHPSGKDDQHANGFTKTFLADNGIRNLFARGLVDVLNREASK